MSSRGDAKVQRTQRFCKVELGSNLLPKLVSRLLANCKQIWLIKYQLLQKMQQFEKCRQCLHNVGYFDKYSNIFIEKFLLMRYNTSG